MNLKDLIFGGGVKSGGDGGTYRDSIQAWLPITKYHRWSCHYKGWPICEDT